MMSYLIWFHTSITIWILYNDFCHAAKDSSLTSVPAANISQISADQSVSYKTVETNSRHKRQADEEDVVNQFEIQRVSPPYELSYEVPPFGNYIENFWDIKTTNATKDEFFSFYDFEVGDKEIVSSQGKNSTPRALPLSEKQKFSPNRTTPREQNDKEHAVIGSGKRSPEKGSLNRYEHHSFSSKFGNYSLVEVQEDDEIHDIQVIPFGERSPLTPSKYDDEHVINRSPGSRLSRGPPADLIHLYQQGKNSKTAKPIQNGEEKKTFKTDTKVLLVNYQKSSLKHSSNANANSTFKSQETGNLNLTVTGAGNVTGKGLVTRKEIYIPFGKRLSPQGGPKLLKPKPNVQTLAEIQSRDDKIKEINIARAPPKGLYVQKLVSTPQGESLHPKSINSKLKTNSVVNLDGGTQKVSEHTEKTIRNPLLRVLARNHTTQVPVTVYFKLGKAVKGTQIPSTVTPVVSTNNSTVVIPNNNDILAKQNFRKGKSQKDNLQQVRENTTKSENPTTLRSTPLIIPLMGGSPKRNTRQPKVHIKTSKVTLFPSSTISTTTERRKHPHVAVTSAKLPEKLLQRNQTVQEDSSATKLPPVIVEEVVTPAIDTSTPPSLEDVLGAHYESLRMITGKPTTVLSTSVTEDFPEVTTQMKKRGKSTPAQIVLQQQRKKTSKNTDDMISKTVVTTTTRKPWLAPSIARQPPQEVKEIANRTEKVDRNAKIQVLNEDLLSQKLNIEQTSSTTSPTESTSSSPRKGRKIHFEPKRKRPPYHLLPTLAHLDAAPTSATPTKSPTLPVGRGFTVSSAKSTKTATTTLHPKSPGRERLTTESTTIQSVSLEELTPSSLPKNRGTGSTRGRSGKQKSTRKTGKTPSRSTLSPRSPSTKTYPLSFGVVVSSDIEAHDKPNLPLLVLISPTKRPGRTVTTPSIGILSTLVSENLTALISAYDDDDYDYDDDSFEDGSKDSLPPYEGFLKFYFQPIRKKSGGSKPNTQLEVTRPTDKYTPEWRWQTKPPTEQKRETATDSFREELSTDTGSTDPEGKSEYAKQNGKRSPQNKRKPKVLAIDRRLQKEPILPSVEYETSVSEEDVPLTTQRPRTGRRNRPRTNNRTRFSSPQEIVTSSNTSIPFTESSTGAADAKGSVSTSKPEGGSRKSRQKTIITNRPNTVTTSKVHSSDDGLTTSAAEDADDAPVTASVNRKESGRIRFPPRKAFEDFHFQPVRIKRIG